MARPRLIIPIRHGESSANCDRTVNYDVPNHLVPLTSTGRSQAAAAGADLAQKIRPGEKVLLYKSPYLRTRQTSEEIEKQLEAAGHDMIIIEEPRLREQDFGNFQDPSVMQDVLEERHRYGSFFFRIPNGESAADVYDRCCSFSESLHRHFEHYTPDVVIMVSHGIWARVFVMKWFNWSYEHFENVKNLDYCEQIVMERKENSNAYRLISELATWDEPPRLRIAKTKAKVQVPDTEEELDELK